LENAVHASFPEEFRTFPAANLEWISAGDESLQAETRFMNALKWKVGVVVRSEQAQSTGDRPCGFFCRRNEGADLWQSARISADPSRLEGSVHNQR
jgi:hypothetical protein